MVTRSTAWPEGTPCWVDLAVDDPRRAARFYTGLFGWEVEYGSEETGGYGMCTIGGKSVAGIGAKMSPDQPTVWTTYLAAGDVDKTASKVTEAGGQVLAEPFDVVDFGRMAVVADTVGAAFGIWQSGKHFGAELANEPGSLVWNEIMSRDLDSAKRFYEAVFGFAYEDMPGGIPYAMFKLNGQTAGGAGVLPEETPAEVPAHWMTYFEVVDTDATVAKAVELGGQVIRPPYDVPSIGRIATVSDNHGAIFSVIEGATE